MSAQGWLLEVIGEHLYGMDDTFDYTKHDERGGSFMAAGIFLRFTPPSDAKGGKITLGQAFNALMGVRLAAQKNGLREEAFIDVNHKVGASSEQLASLLMQRQRGFADGNLTII